LTAYTPEQNGIAERSNKTIFDTTRTIFIAYKIPIYLWEFILSSTVELLNKTVVKRIKISPYQALYDYLHPENIPNIPNLNNEPIISSTIFINIPSELRIKGSKFAPHNEKGQLIGYTSNKIFIIYIPTRPLKSRIIRTSHLEIMNNIPENNNNNNNTTNIIPIIDFQPITKSIIRPIINNQEPDFIINNEVNNTELTVTDKKS
jgi:hypothetical protein